MPNLYTKNGKPLQRRGDNLFSRSGKHVGRIRGRKVFGPDGRYAGTIDGNRVVYRGTDSAVISSPFAPTAHAGTAALVGGTEQLLAGRPGSWEAALVRQILARTVGEDDEHLAQYREG